MKIKHILWLWLVFVGIFQGIFFLINFWLGEKIKMEFEEIIEESRELHEILELENKIAWSVMPVNDYIIRKDPQEKEEFYRLYNKNLELFSALKNDAQNRNDELAILEESQKNYVSIKDRADKIFEIYPGESGENIVQVGELMEEADNLAETSEQTLDQWDALAREEIIDAQAEMIELQQIGKYGVSIFIFAAILLSFAAGILMIRIVLRDINFLVEAAEKITGGNYKFRIREKMGDELSGLALAFNKMLAKVDSADAELKKKVKDSTRELSKTVSKLKESETKLKDNLVNIEEEKEYSQLLAKEREKFKLAVENASDHIVITDSEGMIVYGNKAAEKITGFSAEEIIGKKVGNKMLWGGLMGADFYSKLWKRIKKDKKIFRGEIKNKRKNGEYYDAEVGIVPILNEEGEINFFVGIERDITKEKEIDRAKTEFVSLASHQLRTPLTAINWYTEMLLAGDAGKLNKQQKNFLEEVYHSNKRMVDLVNALLNVSRIDLGTFAIDPKLSDVKPIVESVIDELQPNIKSKKLSLKKSFAKDIPKMMVDYNLIRIIIQNLLTNAIKYTPEKGKVSIDIDKNNKDLKIVVSDTGYGIPKNQQDKIFSKLFRADNAREVETDGTGLGLYVLKSIVDNSGGRVWFESEENKGTTFHVTLPLTGMVKKSGAKGLTAID